jgi:hypothetical protein
LGESTAAPALSPAHGALLLRYVQAAFGDARAESEGASSGAITTADPDDRRRAALAVVRQLDAWRPDGAAWRAVFARADDRAVAAAAHACWRRTDALEAALAFARWLLAAGDGKAAVDVVGRARADLDGADRALLERRWAEALRRAEGDDDDAAAGAAE